jgi:hypothetical protein
MDNGKQYTTERVSLDDTQANSARLFALEGVTPDQLCGLGEADLLRIPAGVFFDSRRIPARRAPFGFCWKARQSPTRPSRTALE